MNAIALETRHSAHTWDIESRTPWHDWACWVPGRHHDELVPTEAARSHDHGPTSARPDRQQAERQPGSGRDETPQRGRVDDLQPTTIRRPHPSPPDQGRRTVERLPGHPEHRRHARLARHEGRRQTTAAGIDGLLEDELAEPPRQVEEHEVGGGVRQLAHLGSELLGDVPHRVGTRPEHLPTTPLGTATSTDGSVASTEADRGRSSTTDSSPIVAPGSMKLNVSSSPWGSPEDPEAATAHEEERVARLALDEEDLPPSHPLDVGSLAEATEGLGSQASEELNPCEFRCDVGHETSLTDGQRRGQQAHEPTLRGGKRGSSPGQLVGSWPGHLDSARARKRAPDPAPTRRGAGRRLSGPAGPPPRALDDRAIVSA